MRHANNRGGQNLYPGIAEGARDRESLLPKSQGLVVFASALALDHHEGGDPSELALVAERPGKQLCLGEVVPHARPITEWEERVPQVDTDVDDQLGRLSGLG